MDGTPVPSGGIPWILAVPAFIFLVGVAIGVVKWIAVRAETEIGKARVEAQLAHDNKEKIRDELMAKLEQCERRADALEREIQAKLEEALDQAYAALNRQPPRPPAPPPGIVRKKKSTKELLEEVRTVTGRFRREDLTDDTQSS